MKLGSFLKSLFKTKKIDDSAFEDIEDALVEGDVGASAAVAIVDELRVKAKKDRIDSYEALKDALYQILDDRINKFQSR